ncbi:MAG: response regulator transcription factor [Vicinamibacterales bacterium]|jgi:DNA-binding response OmpR family regulator|nr:response regulator transcription factor [Vicinamibacterales bacterium]
MSRILVVEDDHAIAFGLRVDLEAEGYTVIVEHDGLRALERARSESFDLVLLDVMLPGRDGFDVCRDLRRSGSRVPIVLLTARAQEAEIVMGLELGADDYVTKPFSPRVLRARVKAALRRTEAEEPAVYTFGDCEVDLARGEFRRGGEPVPLTALEFKLLTTFVRHRQKLLSRAQLLDLAWGPGTFVTDRVVDNHVVALRKKIEPNPAEPRFLLNVRGLGYRFDG